MSGGGSGWWPLPAKGSRISLSAAGRKKWTSRRQAKSWTQEALTIGFARRFALYKRGDLILKDPDRLARILNDPQKPVQIIFAGKAHPQDSEGKTVIKNIIHLSHRPEFRHRMAFIEDYDLNVARYMVQGADVWLNNPRRPLEACGTSGMKATANGALNMSVLDGWWAEGYHPDLGWAIGSGEEYENYEYQNQVESQAIYDLLERHIGPLFYQRGRDNLPRGWIAVMKKSMGNLVARFNAHRMLQDYVHRFYLPLSLNWERISANHLQEARALAAWIQQLRGNWSQLRILEKRVSSNRIVPLGETLKVEVVTQLGRVLPQDISVSIYYGLIDSKADFKDRRYGHSPGYYSRMANRPFSGERFPVRKWGGLVFVCASCLPIPYSRIPFPWD